MSAEGIGLIKRSLDVDIGIVVQEAEACLAFYRDVLGIEHLGTIDMGGGASMDRSGVANRSSSCCDWSRRPRRAILPAGVHRPPGCATSPCSSTT
jgi:hypothetical protein